MKPNEREYTVEMLIDGFWEAPRTIFAPSEDAAVSQAKKLIEKYGATKTRMYGWLAMKWMNLHRFMGTSKTLHPF